MLDRIRICITEIRLEALLFNCLHLSVFWHNLNVRIKNPGADAKVRPLITDMILNWHLIRQQRTGRTEDNKGKQQTADEHQAAREQGELQTAEE